MINDWKNGDNEGLRDFLSTVDWKRELEDMDTENSWQLIKDKINTGINNFIPKVPRRKPNNHQWMTKNVKRLVRTKQRHYNLYMHTRSPIHFDQFKQSEKKCKKGVRAAKKYFERKIAKNGNREGVFNGKCFTVKQN